LLLENSYYNLGIMFKNSQYPWVQGSVMNLAGLLPVSHVLKIMIDFLCQK